MRRCIDWYLPAGPLSVIDLGATDVNGSYRSLLPSTVSYLGVDLEPGPGVDVVLEDPYHLPFEGNSVDVAMSGQMLEHCGQFWRVFSEVERVLKPGGIAFMIAPSAGPVHRYPVDCYRFYPDSYAACAEWANLRLVQSWTDHRGPWHDIVGVFQKGGELQPRLAPMKSTFVNNPAPPHPDPAVETTQGKRDYIDVLRDLHVMLQPKNYLEIGVRSGTSLKLANCPAVAIDPSPLVSHFDANVRFFETTSDDFFFFHADDVLKQKVDLAFIDGMHLSDFVYRDFINIEKRMSKTGVIVIDDVLPNHRVQADRNRKSRVWTGDVWRFAKLLAEHRKDLSLTWLDTSPSGLLLITKLDPANRVLTDTYNGHLRKLISQDEPVDDDVITRRFALPPTAEVLTRALRG